MRHLFALLIVISFMAGVEAKRAPANVMSMKKIKVMIFDTGISVHPALKGHVVYGPGDDFIDRHGHGTHVAGIIVYGNKMMRTSDKEDALCPNIEIHSCKYWEPRSRIDALEAGIDCVKRATREKMDFVNISGGGTEYSQREYDAYKAYTDGGGVVYAAAGNDNARLERKGYYPASYGLPYLDQKPIKNLIAVVNVDRNGEKVPSSNWYENPQKEVGYNVLSTLPGESYGYMTGTSQASPGLLHIKLKQLCKQFEK